MKHDNGKSSIAAWTAIAASVLVTGTALAADALEEITVSGTRVTKSVVSRDPANGTPTERLALTRPVDYKDLDISTVLGAKELEKRVTAVAQSVCDELNRLVPTAHEDPECVRNATQDGMKKANEVIMRYSNAKAQAKKKS